MADSTSTQTDQQNSQYATDGGANDDQGSSSSQDTNDGTVNAPNYSGLVSASVNSSSLGISSSTSNSGTTVAGKAGSSSANQQSLPGKRLSNPLGNFSSYTYQLTLYMVTPDAYNAFVTSGKTNINAIATNNGAVGNQKALEGVYIVAQSGGINNNTSVRAPGFNLDYYIDNLEIDAAISQGKSDNSAGAAPTNVSTVKFQIIEPYGFSFITKLKNAWNTLTSKLPNVNSQTMAPIANRQVYVLGIRFLGYDKDGNVVTGQNRLNGQTIQSPTADATNGSFETFYDIQFSNITFKLDGRAVTYNIEASGIGDVQGKGLTNGRLLDNVNLTGDTVGAMLSDLVSQLNNTQKKYLGEGTIELPNIYDIVYIGPDADAISTSSVVNSAVDSDKQKYPMQTPKPDQTLTEKDANDAKPNGNQRVLQFKGAGATPIVQVVQSIVTQSDYIQNSIKDLFTNDSNPNPDPNTDEIPTANTDSSKILKWVNVSTEVINLGYDRKKNDFSWKITYIINSYQTPVAPLPQVNKTKPYYGPVKRYEYWLTGKNSEVLRFELNYNSLYTQSIVGNTSTTDSQSVIPNAIMRANSPKQGRVAGEALESQNAYVTYLNDAGAYADAHLTILGDPDWLLQTNASSLNAIFDQYYGANGYTINCNNGQVFVEVDFKEAIDYDNTKGVMSINDQLMFFDYPPEYKTGPNKIQGIAFNVIDVKSTFKGGKFEQTLHLAASVWDTPTTSTSSADNAGAGRGGQGGPTASQLASANNPPAGLVQAPATPTNIVETVAAPNMNSNVPGTLLQPTVTATQVTAPTGNASTPQVANDDAQSQNTTSAPSNFDGATEDDQRAESAPTISQTNASVLSAITGGTQSLGSTAVSQTNSSVLAALAGNTQSSNVITSSAGSVATAQTNASILAAITGNGGGAS